MGFPFKKKIKYFYPNNKGATNNIIYILKERYDYE